jgi:hypothetical protein
MGLVFLLIGILGFVPALVTAPPPEPAVSLHASYGVLFGLFPVNVLHNLLHLAFGIWGVVVWRSFPGSRVFARSVAIAYAVLAIMGLFPGLNTIFGLLPMFGHDIWLHAAIAIVSAYFGYAPVTTVEAGGDISRRP